MRCVCADRVRPCTRGIVERSRSIHCGFKERGNSLVGIGRYWWPIFARGYIIIFVLACAYVARYSAIPKLVPNFRRERPYLRASYPITDRGGIRLICK